MSYLYSAIEEFIKRLTCHYPNSMITVEQKKLCKQEVLDFKVILKSEFKDDQFKIEIGDNYNIIIYLQIPLKAIIETTEDKIIEIRILELCCTGVGYWKIYYLDGGYNSSVVTYHTTFIKRFHFETNELLNIMKRIIDSEQLSTNVRKCLENEIRWNHKNEHD